MKQASLVIIIIVVTLAIGAPGCGLGTQYGLEPIVSPSGKKLYFRREARGLNFDSLSLSANPNYCAKPDPEEALIFNGLGGIGVFYRFQHDELHLYNVGELSLPPKLSKTIKVVVHEITNPQFIELGETHREKGIERSEVPLRSTLVCLF